MYNINLTKENFKPAYNVQLTLKDNIEFTFVVKGNNIHKIVNKNYWERSEKVMFFEGKTVVNFIKKVKEITEMKIENDLVTFSGYIDGQKIDHIVVLSNYDNDLYEDLFKLDYDNKLLFNTTDLNICFNMKKMKLEKPTINKDIIEYIFYNKGFLFSTDGIKAYYKDKYIGDQAFCIDREMIKDIVKEKFFDVSLYKNKNSMVIVYEGINDHKEMIYCNIDRAIPDLSNIISKYNNSKSILFYIGDNEINILKQFREDYLYIDYDIMQIRDKENNVLYFTKISSQFIDCKYQIKHIIDSLIKINKYLYINYETKVMFFESTNLNSIIMNCK